MRWLVARDLKRNTHLPPEHPANLNRLGTGPDLTVPEQLDASHLRLPLVARPGIGQIRKSLRTGTVHDNGLSRRRHNSPYATDSPAGPWPLVARHGNSPVRRSDAERVQMAWRSSSGTGA
jgi:hypothetical protein